MTGAASGEFAGRLGERVTLYRPIPERDEYGCWTGGWATIGQAWAVVEPNGEGPAIAGEARTSWPRWRVTMRPTALFVDDRIGWGAVFLRVLAVRHDPAAPDRMTAFTEEEEFT